MKNLYLCNVESWRMKFWKYILIIVVLGVIGCKKTYTPKGYGYYRIDVPEFNYEHFAPKGYPYQFELSTNAVVDFQPRDAEPYWIDIRYPQFRAKIHCTYKRIRNRKDFRAFSNECQDFVYNHVNKASSIPEKEFSNDSLHVWGLFYELRGNTASPIQLYLTDSVHHFFRGAVYIESLPNQDSLAPVINYIVADAMHLVETFQWQ